MSFPSLKDQQPPCFWCAFICLNGPSQTWAHYIILCAALHGAVNCLVPWVALFRKNIYVRMHCTWNRVFKKCIVHSKIKNAFIYSSCFSKPLWLSSLNHKRGFWKILSVPYNRSQCGLMWFWTQLSSFYRQKHLKYSYKGYLTSNLVNPLKYDFESM